MCDESVKQIISQDDVFECTLLRCTDTECGPAVVSDAVVLHRRLTRLVCSLLWDSG